MRAEEFQYSDGLHTLRLDFEELHFLLEGYRHALCAAEFTEERLGFLGKGLETSLCALLQETEAMIASLESLQPSSELENLRAKRDSIFMVLRSITRVLGGYLCQEEWQSPPFRGFLPRYPALAREREHSNDYRRDRHVRSQSYEAQFVKEFYPSAKAAFLCNSGMAAFVTIAHHLAPRLPSQGKLLLGKRSYHENKDVLQGMFGERVLVFDEADATALQRLLMQHRSTIVFFDSFCNSYELFSPDVELLCSMVCDAGSIAVVDNTGRPFAFQDDYWADSREIFVIESLLKYHQYGLDVQNAGIVLCYQDGSPRDFWLTRAHVGSNLSDSAVAALPTPNARMLGKRLSRMQRNADRLRHSLCDMSLRFAFLDNREMRGQREYAGASLGGTLINIAFQKSWRKLEHYRKYQDLLHAEAEAIGVELHGGTSFGFRHSRFYLTAATTEFGEPFLRLAVGTEAHEELERLIMALERAGEKFLMSVEHSHFAEGGSSLGM